MVKVVGDTSLIPFSVINWGLTLIFCIQWISDMSFFHRTAEFRRFLPPFLFFLIFAIFRNVLFLFFNFLNSFNFQYIHCYSLFDVPFLAKSIFLYH